jgi:hypothetical protein
MKHPVPAALTLFASIVLAAPASAQTLWHGLDRPSGLIVELHHPEFEGDGFNALTSVLLVGTRIDASESLDLVLDLPLAYADGEFDTDFAVGAPYLGIETWVGETLIEAGLRIPIASNNFASAVGTATEIVDRFDAFASEAFVLTLHAMRGGKADSGFHWRLRGGPRAVLSTDGGGGELFVDLGGVIGYESTGFGIEGGPAVLGIVTTDGSPGERTLIEAGVQAYRRLERDGRVGVLLRLPVDDDAGVALEFTIGVVAVIPLD